MAQEDYGASYDYIVVGAGSTGCVVASRLSEDPKNRVLVLEAGGRDEHLYLKMPLAFLKAMPDPRFNWTYMTEPEPHLGGRQLPLPRGKVMGGSGSINGMFAMRGHPADYDQWAQMGARGWSFADVLPYFRKSESSWRGDSDYHGTDGPIKIRPIDSPHLLHEPMMQTAEAAGFSTTDDLAGAHPEGFARGEQTVDARGRRVSGATAYLKPAMGRQNLDVRSGVLVHRLAFDGKRCIGVEIEGPDGPQIVRAAREVIVSGGAYNSPHLLMLSGIGPAEHLKSRGVEVLHNSPGVGRNLQEHPCAMLEFNAARPVTFLKHLRWDKIAMNSIRWALTGKGLMATQVNSCNVVIRTADHLDRPDLQIMVNPIRFDAQPWFPGIKAEQDHVFWAGVVQLHPESRGWVELKSSDPRETASVTLNILSEEADREQMRRAFRTTRKIYNTAPMADLIESERTPGAQVESDEELDAFIQATCYVAQHPTSTCAMGMGEHSVVDNELRVIGVEGLRVADCSIMPTVPGGNTNLPAFMVGEKAADLIMGRSLPRAELPSRDRATAKGEAA
ncbi:choline dehydrogenase [Altererythrobacter atlanticus]|uniref:Oxygen-dependent choline dehydrogenase n=1 Tax=Croceibacterium atlanticum TaxID=1267766 RepID=A0A0F7KXF4_9SPHN|nr:GMC family oxidoreductase N-terminal domain-containing protein [Croceibacterium atlanticum]AKH43896.1 Oxygen-dependent choline dehydrogenase [Croceibacterium atlanticum]MBB5733654.1 choline dehydrogenase [Croceibacterium atlanticum]